MLLFDYGQTLLNEQGFNGLNGYRAVLNRSKANKKLSYNHFKVCNWQELIDLLKE